MGAEGDPGMTEKELHKLKPKDLVMLLLQQTGEIAQLYEHTEKVNEELRAVVSTNDELKEALNESDGQIETLKRDLDDLDFQISNLEAEKKIMYADLNIPLKEVGSLAEAARKLNEIFLAAQREADRYSRKGMVREGVKRAGQTEGARRFLLKKAQSSAGAADSENKAPSIRTMEPFSSELVKGGVLQLESEDSAYRDLLDDLKKIKKSSQNAEQLPTVYPKGNLK